jgi:hypothetical protein
MARNAGDTAARDRKITLRAATVASVDSLRRSTRPDSAEPISAVETLRGNAQTNATALFGERS